MSLYGALFTGVSGLSANSQALGIISNNISNVNTVGYKSSEAQFATILASTTDAGSFSSGGVRASANQLIGKQGLLQTSESATDLAVSGSGFFTVTEGNTINPDKTELLYTRAGSFTQDADGFLRNQSGYYLQGWALDSTGGLPTNRNLIEPINLGQLTGTATQTGNIELRANLSAAQTADGAYVAGDVNAGTVSAHFERTLEVFDTQGGAQPLRLAFVKSAANTWEYEIIYDGDVTNIGGAANNPVATGTVTFNSDGTVANVNGAAPAAGTAAITIPWDLAASGLGTQAITLDFGTIADANGLTQFDSASTLISSGVDGALFGGISGVRVDTDGVVIALFDNGVERAVYKLPVANFQNPEGLSAANGNAYIRTDESGDVTLLEANTGGAGAVAASSLEASTVDLAEEFTKLITTQRAYSAATKIITTADEMLEEMIRIKR